MIGMQLLNKVPHQLRNFIARVSVKMFGVFAEHER